MALWVHLCSENHQPGTLFSMPLVHIRTLWLTASPTANTSGRRNCSRDGDFQKEVKLLYTRLRDRGYSHSTLKKAYNRAKAPDRNMLIHKKKIKSSSQAVRIITSYTKQHKQVRKIFSKYWPLLLADPIACKYVESQPLITYRRARSLKDRLTQSHFQMSSLPISTTGTFPWKKCDKCCFMLNHHEINLPNGQIHRIKHRITCQTPGIVYLMQCTCKCFYVGKTKLIFSKRINDHISLIRKRRMETPISRHVGLYHGFKLDKFMALEHIPLDIRGGSNDSKRLQLESQWINLLKATVYPGLNEILSFKPFL